MRATNAPSDPATPCAMVAAESFALASSSARIRSWTVIRSPAASPSLDSAGVARYGTAARTSVGRVV